VSAELVGGPTGARLAGFWSRLLGWVIDAAVAALLFVPSLVVLVAGPRDVAACHVDLRAHLVGLSDTNARCTGPTGSTWTAVAVLFALAVIGLLAYQALLAGGPRGQTLGMRVVGVRLVDETTGSSVGGATAIVRYLFGATISGWLLSLGYLWNLWDVRRQTWHDKVTSAVVIRT
jgi:uncharacterized RDD family membrane protein YckC